MPFIKDQIPGHDELLFLPLGGCNEIGMNLTLYGHNGQWLMVDCGISFAGDYLPGIDVIMPDTNFIEDNAHLLAGLVLTHAHEDHLGAVAYLWPFIDPDFTIPIYATDFTMNVLKGKLAQAGLENQLNLKTIALSSRFNVGVFDIQMVNLTHSIPEPNALIIRTDAGNLLHSGDWKLDPDPVIGATSDEAALINIGKEGVLAFICDSTNIFEAGHSVSEGVVGETLIEKVQSLKNRVFITCFASNVARLQTIFNAAIKAKRKVILSGRSLHRMVEYAKMAGYLKNIPPLYDEEDYNSIPPDDCLVICTGSQGEGRASLARIAQQSHPRIAIEKGDNVIFSSRTIPGNDSSIGYVKNSFIRLEVNVIDDDFLREGEHIHTSGHPKRDELMHMYQWVRPKIALPVHGEARHLQAHADFAKTCQIPHQYVPYNGALLSLNADSGAKLIDEVMTDKFCLDGDKILSTNSRAIRERRKISLDGLVFVSMLAKDGHLLSAPEITIKGIDCNDNEYNDIVELAENSYLKQGKNDRSNIDNSRENIRIALRRYLRKLTSKNPMVEVHLFFA